MGILFDSRTKKQKQKTDLTCFYKLEISESNGSELERIKWV